MPSHRARLLAAPVFILSAPRSGSTLLRAILGSHSRLYAPPELPLAHLSARAETRWIQTSLKALLLTTDELDHMLWDRVLADALARSGKAVVVAKTPSNVLLWQRIAECWPDARFIALLRHPVAIVASLHQSWDASWHPDGTGTIEETVDKALRYMTKVDEARRALPAHTVRYEHLTAAPETVVRGLCGFIDVRYEPAMLHYGRFPHARFAAGLGDASPNIRSGRIQPAAPPPQGFEIPPPLAEICHAWGYGLPNQPASRGLASPRGASRDREPFAPDATANLPRS
jgi:hypothetical protein